MLTVRACGERKGIKTVLLTPEWGVKTEQNCYSFFVYLEANAIVSTGSTDRETKLSSPTKVIGLGESKLTQLALCNPPFLPQSGPTLDDSSITGACDWCDWVQKEALPTDW